MSAFWVAAGVLAIVCGVVTAVRHRERVDRLILWGGCVDVGVILLSLGLASPAGQVGAVLMALYHGTARVLAWVALGGLVPRGTPPTVDALRGIISRRPVRTTAFGFGLVAALGVSPFMTPEGLLLVTHALAHGALWLAVLLALPLTLLTWLTARALLSACLTPCDFAPVQGAQPLGDDTSLRCAGLAGLVIFMGLARSGLLDLAAWGTHNPLFTLPTLEAPSGVWALRLLYGGAFLLLLQPLHLFTGVSKNMRNGYALALSLLAFVVTVGSDLNPLAWLFALIATGIGVIVTWYSLGYIAEDRRKSVYLFLLLLTFAAVLGVVTAGTAGTLAGYWELMSWASFFLIAWEESQSARAAAIKYLVICGAGAYVLIPALFVLTDQSGSLLSSFASVGSVLSGENPSLLVWALVLAVFGFAAKAGLVPLHSWLPDAHPAAPSSISAPLSGVLTKTGVFGLVLVLLLLTTRGGANGQASGYLSLPCLLTVTLGLATMGYGEWMALKQDDIKRLLAYSTMGQVGEIVTVVGLGTWLSTTGALAHVLNHALMKDLLFLCAGTLILRTGSRKLEQLSGLARHMPWTVGCMVIGLVSIMGLPPFNGFVSKYVMIVACMDAGQPLLALALLVASLMGAVYYMRVLRTLVFDPAPNTYLSGATAVCNDEPWALRLPLVVLAGLCVFLGLVPQAGLALVAPVADMLAGLGRMPLQSLPAVYVSWPLYVLLPMLGALAPVYFRADPRKAGFAAVLVLAITAALVLLFAWRLDGLSYGMALVITLMGVLNLVYAVGYMEHSHTQWRFYAFFLLMTGGLLGVAVSTDVFSFFTFWEIMSSWTLFFAIAHEGSPAALREAFKYFLFNIAGAACLFMGIGIIASTGAADFSAVAAAMATLSPAWGTATMALLALGFTMKAAQVALRIDWQMHPNLAPTPVSGYISSVLLKIAVFGMVKLFFEFGGASLRAPDLADPFHQQTIMYLVAWAGALTLLYAAIKAMGQRQIKMVFIWSTVSQIGYMVLGVALGTSLGVAGGLLHVINHVFFKDLLFFVAGAVMLRTHLENIDEMGGLGRKMPVTMGCFALGALAAVGVPPTSGFTSKWIIYQALMQAGEPLLALVSLVGSVITLAYLVRFLHVVFLGQATRPLDHLCEAPPVMLWPMKILAVLSVLTGVFPGLLLLPINAMLGEYGLARLDVSLGGINSGAGAWNASLMSVLVLVAVGASWYGLQRLMGDVPERRLDPHACGLDVREVFTPVPAASTYPAVNALLSWRTPKLWKIITSAGMFGVKGKENKERPSC